jgi:D-sedoheptulose 7-phosphate isomerase
MGLNYDLYRSGLLQALQKISNNDLDKLTNAILNTLGNGTVYICGNGGSASTAEHMSCDLSKSIYKLSKRTNENRLKVVSLNSNVAKITALANDSDYKNIFSDQLIGLANPGDLLIVITASGNSPNILEVLNTAKTLGLYSFGLLGFGGVKAR